MFNTIINNPSTMQRLPGPRSPRIQVNQNITPYISKRVRKIFSHPKPAENKFSQAFPIKLLNSLIPSLTATTVPITPKIIGNSVLITLDA